MNEIYQTTYDLFMTNKSGKKEKDEIRKAFATFYEGGNEYAPTKEQIKVAQESCRRKRRGSSSSSSE